MGCPCAPNQPRPYNELMCPGSLEPKSWRERLRDLLVLAALCAVGGVPVGLLVSWAAPLPTTSFLAVAAGLLVASLACLWTWTRLDRPMHRSWFWTSMVFFLVGDVGVVGFFVLLIARGLRSLGV